MAKKEKIAIQRDATLELVDAELDSAMSQLDGANQKVEELLSSFVPPDATAQAVDGPAAAELEDSANPYPEHRNLPGSSVVWRAGE
ncbi:MAG: hypothetical protein HZB26_25970 [Candidatus Hydrogenedentes bacterium]|nr:hypothetical protein [Candidatus Hydrogenedentota bacterium]